jgi:MHS family proline/betaine transporter-like MFS transporter
LLFALASYKIHPLKLLKWRLMIFLPFMCLCPYLLQNAQNGISILWGQCISIFFSLTNVPASGVFVIHFPVLKRFTYTSFIYAMTRAATYVLTSFSLVYLTELFGYWGLLLILVPISLGFLWGVYHFEFLEKMIEAFPAKKLEGASSS